MNELSLFTGAGCGLLGSVLLGWRTVCGVEIDGYCQRVLFQRQRDGYLPRFPIWDDIKTFNGKPWCGTVDVVSGGFPCQDISSAGRGEGITGSRSGLVFEMLRIIEEVRPRYVFGENSALLRTRGLNRIIQELTKLGYDCRWCVLGAKNIGAPHERNRMWFFAYPNNGWKRNVRKYGEVGGAQKIQKLPTPTASLYGTNVGGAQGRTGKIRPSIEKIFGGIKIPLREWMMYLPIGWTGLEQLEMGKYQEWLYSLGEFLQKVSVLCEKSSTK